MKTRKGAIAIATLVFMAAPFFGAISGEAATKPHKVLLQNLTVDSIDTTAKTITAHSTSASYTVNTGRAKIRRATGEKASFSGFLEFLADDSITVWGKTTDGININASKIRNNSTRKIKGLYLSTIVIIAPVGTSLPGGAQGAFLMVKNNNQIAEVLTYGYTKFKFGKHKTTYADLLAGDVVSLKGVVRTYDDSEDIVYNTTQARVRSHGAAPSFPLVPTSFKLNR